MGTGLPRPERVGVPLTGRDYCVWRPRSIPFLRREVPRVGMFQPASSPSAAALAASPLMTAEELFRLSDDGWRHALVRAELQRRTLAGFRHGTVSTNVVVPLAHHVRTRRLGVVCGAGTGFVLARNPDAVLGPDVAFMRRERIPASGLPATFGEGVPGSAAAGLGASGDLPCARARCHAAASGVEGGARRRPSACRRPRPGRGGGRGWAVRRGATPPLTGLVESGGGCVRMRA